jgi:hypothetical protein
MKKNMEVYVLTSSSGPDEQVEERVEGIYVSESLALEADTALLERIKEIQDMENALSF